MYKIAYILTFFRDGKGNWPNYIDWFMASCKANKTIDFFIFTDDREMGEKWGNVSNIKFEFMTFQECVERIRTKVGDIKINKPYKLCDMKPTFGRVFSDYLEGYDFWAYGDCDLIWGDLRKHLPDAFLDKYDWFQCLGNLQIIRNKEEMNNYYLLERAEWSRYKEKSWKKVIETERNISFNEWTGIPMILRENGKRIYWNRENLVNIYQEDKGFKKMIDNTVQHNTLFQYWLWENGAIYHVNKLTGKKTERLYIHFSSRKMKPIPYKGQKRAYITVNSEIKDSISWKETFGGKDFFVAYARKIRVYIIWHLKHPRGKDKSEV